MDYRLVQNVEYLSHGLAWWRSAGGSTAPRLGRPSTDQQPAVTYAALHISLHSVGSGRDRGQPDRQCHSYRGAGENIQRIIAGQRAPLLQVRQAGAAVPSCLSCC